MVLITDRLTLTYASISINSFSEIVQKHKQKMHSPKVHIFLYILTNGNTHIHTRAQPPPNIHLCSAQPGHVSHRLHWPDTFI